MCENLDLFGTGEITRDHICICDFSHAADLAGSHAIEFGHLREGVDSFTLNCDSGCGDSMREVRALGRLKSRARRHSAPRGLTAIVSAAWALDQVLRAKKPVRVKNGDVRYLYP